MSWMEPVITMEQKEALTLSGSQKPYLHSLAKSFLYYNRQKNTSTKDITREIKKYKTCTPSLLLSMFILIVCFLFILDDMKSSSSFFQVIWCGCQEEKSCKTTSYLPKSHIIISIHVVHFQNIIYIERPKSGSISIYGF